MAAHYSSADTRRRTVLVAVVNNATDLQHAADDGWYRIPQRRAPRRIGADYLAFYQTGVSGTGRSADNHLLCAHTPLPAHDTGRTAASQSTTHAPQITIIA